MVDEVSSSKFQWWGPHYRVSFNCYRIDCCSKLPPCRRDTWKWVGLFSLNRSNTTLLSRLEAESREWVSGLPAPLTARTFYEFLLPCGMN